MAILNPVRPTADPAALDAFFTSSSDGALILNRMRRILSINPSASQITGWSERDLAQVTCRSFGCRDERGQSICRDSCLAQQCIENGQPIGPRFMRISKADGSGASVEATLIPLAPSDRRTGTCLMVVKDIGLLEHLDATLRRRDEELAEKNMILRGVLESLSAGWRAALLEMRTATEALSVRHARELGDLGLVQLTRIVGATQKIESVFAQLKAQVQGALQSRH